MTDLVEAVLDLVDRIPPGRVASYGDVAAAVGARSPRQVGAVMSRYGGAVAWHRVVRADGRPAARLAPRQLALLRAEGVPLTTEGSRVDMSRARWAAG